MLYCVPQELRETDNGTGFILDMLWYERDPEVEIGQSPVLVDQVVIPASSIEHVTPALIDAAIDRRRPEVERMTAPPVVPPAGVKAMLGRARAVDGTMRPRAAAEMRAEAEAEQRRLEIARSKGKAEKGSGVSRG